MGKKLFFVFSIDYQLISHRRKLVEQMVKEGYDVTVVAQNTGYRQEIVKMGVRFVDLPVNRVGMNIKEELRTLYFLYKLYRREKPDIVHHVSMKIVLWGGVAAKMAGVKGVVNAVNGLGVLFQDGEVHGFMRKGCVWAMKFAHFRSNIITIFQNIEDKSFFLRHRILKESQTFIIQGSGVDLDVFRYMPEQQREPIRIVFSSRMVEEKGVMDIIEAAKLLKKEYENKITFLLYGLLETNPKAVSKEYLDKECDGRYICYCGFTEDIKSVLEGAAIVLLPSYYREGIPKSLIEATAIGRPIITTDWVGCRETVIDGKNGYLVPIKSVEKITEKLKLLINSADLRKNMGDASRKVAEGRFSLKTVIERHLEVYKRLEF